MKLTIDSIAFRGAGVGRHEGKVYFVPFTCPGETVEIEIVKDTARFAVGRLVKVLESSPNRIPFAETPGCCYAHLTYAAELAAKKAQLEYFLKVPVTSVTPSPLPLGYRNKITLEAGSKGVLGYRGDDNETIVDMPQDPLACPEINAALTRFRTGTNRPEPGDKVTFRYTPHDGVQTWVGRAPVKQLTENTPAGAVQVAADGFFQVNPAVADLLIRQTTAELESAETIYDLCCGVGVFGFAARRKYPDARLVGIESNPGAIDAARRNAVSLELANTSFHACAIEDSARYLKPGKCTVIIDPPRAGLSPAAVKLIKRLRPGQICYVSCAPDTLARDLKQFESDYTLERAHIFDMFPRTAHFETLAVLKKKI